MKHLSVIRLFAALLLIFVVIIPARAQSVARYQADLDLLYEQLQQTYSFKDQIKGARKVSFDSLYQALRKDTALTGNNFAVFLQLARLFFPIKDNHLGFYQFAEQTLDPVYYHNKQFVDQYQQSRFFTSFPTISLSLDSLQKALSTKPTDAIEGIYYYDTLLTVGVYRTVNPGELIGVVLRTSLPVWKPGQVAAYLYEQEPNIYKALYAHPIYKSFLLYGNEKYRNQSLINSWFYSSPANAVYSKTPTAADYVNLPRTTPALHFRSLNASVQYLRLGTFYSSNEALKTSQVFYEQIKDSLTAPHLIVDLRDNTGGGEKASNKFMKLLKRYHHKGKIYLLINNGTTSHGEIFTVRLRKAIKVPAYGQTTRGTIAYGVNYSTTLKFPSGRFGAVMTDMKDKGFSPYETVGVAPDQVWDNSEDWIDKLLRIIGQP